MKAALVFASLTCVAAAYGQFGMVRGGTISNVRFQTAASGDDAKTNAPGIYVMSSRVQLENYWSQHHAGRPPMNDFSQWRMVAIHLGNRPTGGYGIGVLKMERKIDTALISAVETVPGRNSYVSQRVTSPWVLVRVEQGAFGFQLQTKRVQGFAGTNGNVYNAGNGVKVIFGPGGGCDHCNHRGSGGCHCDRHDRGCDCRG